MLLYSVLTVNFQATLKYVLLIRFIQQKNMAVEERSHALLGNMFSLLLNNVYFPLRSYLNPMKFKQLISVHHCI